MRLDSQKHLLLLTLHHIIADGWSTRILHQEIKYFYESLVTGRSTPLPELPIQYSDYALWQRQWLQGEVLNRQLDYWKQQLENAPSLLPLPTDRPRPTVQTHRGARLPITITRDTTAGLKALAIQEKATLFMVVLAAFQLLLSRYTGEQDIVVGTPIANRRYLETEKLIGCFANTLVLRSDLSGNPTFRELLARIRTTTQAAYAHQDLPFEKLVEALHPDRDMSRMPLFQVMFAFQNLPDTGAMESS
ncbi:MAG: condensation domain-containing protein, partial [Synechocystis sp.]